MSCLSCVKKSTGAVLQQGQKDHKLANATICTLTRVPCWHHPCANTMVRISQFHHLDRYAAHNTFEFYQCGIWQYSSKQHDSMEFTISRILAWICHFHVSQTLRLSGTHDGRCSDSQFARFWWLCKHSVCFFLRALKHLLVGQVWRRSMPNHHKHLCFHWIAQHGHLLPCTWYNLMEMLCNTGKKKIAK